MHCSASKFIIFQEYEELKNKLNDFKEREQRVKERLQLCQERHMNFQLPINYATSTNSDDAIALAKQKHGYPQNTNNTIVQKLSQNQQHLSTILSPPSTITPTSADSNGTGFNLPSGTETTETTDDIPTENCGKFVSLQSFIISTQVLCIFADISNNYLLY